ncbi:MAG: sugar ABC transporter permease [Acholeplasmataceae bacterium]|jgi:ABC-type sugar transport system permease subunit|nr:sugar ABC transporter permease [Acholeplasmataceae bacterium]
MKTKKQKSAFKTHNRAAYYFLIPWLIGIMLFVVYPVFYTIYLSFNSVVSDITGWTNTWIGFANYETAFFRNTDFTPLVLDFLVLELTYVPTIIIVSFILSLLLNTNIKFRAGFRMIYFFPVVVLSGPVLSQLMGTNSTSIIQADTIIIFRMVEQYSRFLAEILSGIFSNFAVILWFTGIPIVLFLNGLQKINSQLYEAAQIDGANSWQILWKITIPNMKSTALVVAIYSVVQLAILEINPIYGYLVSNINQNYASGLGFSSSIVMVYSIIVIALVGLAFFVLKERDKVEYEMGIRERREKQAEKLRRLQLKKNQTVKEYATVTWNKIKRIIPKKKEVKQDDSETELNEN